MMTIWTLKANDFLEKYQIYFNFKNNQRNSIQNQIEAFFIMKNNYFLKNSEKFEQPSFLEES